MKEYDIHFEERLGLREFLKTRRKIKIPELLNMKENEISENRSFDYKVVYDEKSFKPAGFENAIIMFHGFIKNIPEELEEVSPLGKYIIQRNRYSGNFISYCTSYKSFSKVMEQSQRDAATASAGKKYGEFKSRRTNRSFK